MLTPDQVSSFKQILVERNKKIEQELQATDYFGTERAHPYDSVGELSNYDNHPADSGTELYERQKDIALVEHYEKEQKDISHALENIASGTYGRCETCQKDIPFERLEALPTAVHCKDHSPDQFVSERRPIEEEILSPGFGKFDNSDKDATFFDAEDSWQEVAQFGTSETPSDFEDPSMLDYNSMYVDSDESISYVEDIESFVGTDIEGRDIQVYPNAIHQLYEERLDSEGVMADIGNLGNPKLESFEDE